MQLFFSTVVSELHSHFEILFGGGDEEGQEETEETVEKGNQRTGGVFQQFGCLPIVLRVCETSLTPFDVVMGWSVCQTFYIASYIITKNRYEEQQIKQMQMKR